jgi:hypothetical protein
MQNEMEQWVYEHAADGTARFVLGTVGADPLVCFGINPSTATPGAPENTVERAGCGWLSLGQQTTRGNPRHPLYRPRNSPLVPFDTGRYLAAARPGEDPQRHPSRLHARVS